MKGFGIARDAALGGLDQLTGVLEGVRERIEQAGARVLYLPPYSPDFNPIEQCWAKIKEYLRTAKARLLDMLEQAITAAIAAITAQNAAAWFHHSGYGVR